MLSHYLHCVSVCMKLTVFCTVLTCYALGYIYPVRLRTRGRVITLSVHPWVCLCVCVRHKNEHFERNRAVYELYLLHTSQK